MLKEKYNLWLIHLGWVVQFQVSKWILNDTTNIGNNFFQDFLALFGGVLENEVLQVEHHLQGCQSKGRDMGHLLTSPIV